jgi:hypothetical protein
VHNFIKTHVKVEKKLRIFLISLLDEGKWLASRLGSSASGPVVSPDISREENTLPLPRIEPWSSGPEPSTSQNLSAQAVGPTVSVL